jgi:exodeoxyribonuclease-3
MNSLKIATWNVNSLRVRLPHVLQWIMNEKPDVLALQEIKMLTEGFPLQEIQAAGYESIVNGQKTYNGVAILCKKELYSQTNVIMEIPELDDPQRRILAATIDDIRILNLYVPNGESVTSEKYQYKLKWLDHLKRFLQKELAEHPRMIILGDFNIAPDNADVYDPAALAGKVLFSDLERAEFQAMLKLGFHDCFRLTSQAEKTFSWWDYRVNAFKRNMGLRIDHILASAPLVQHCHLCVIDKAPREWERPSDHAPVIAEFGELYTNRH